jgi:hypothetical protein
MKEDEILETVEKFLDGQRQYDTKTGKTIKPYRYLGSQRFVWGNEYVAIQGLLDLYFKEKARATKLEKDYSEALTKIDELEVRTDEYAEYAYGEDL